MCDKRQQGPPLTCRACSRSALLATRVWMGGRSWAREALRTVVTHDWRVSRLEVEVTSYTKRMAWAPYRYWRKGCGEEWIMYGYMLRECT